MPEDIPQKIAVRLPNWLGDAVMATPVLENLRALYPNAWITALCQGAVGDILKENPYVNSVFSFKKEKNWFFSSALTRKLKEEKYDLGILTTNSFSSALAFWKGGVKKRLGYALNGRSFLLTDPVAVPKNSESQHLVKTYQMLLKPLGSTIFDKEPKIFVSEDEKRACEQKLLAFGITPSDKVLGINPGAAYGSAKCWLPERFKELNDRLVKERKDLKILYFGDTQGTPLVNQICEGAHPHIINMAGKTTLRELIASIDRCQLFLTNDSGPMHLASALDVPLIALFGSTSDTKTGPYKGGLVIHKRVACSPCYKRECPIDFPCMKLITVEEVFQTIQSKI